MVTGRSSLDLVNATLRTPDELGAFLLRTGVVEVAPAVPKVVLGEALELRRAVAAAVDAVVAGAPAPGDALRLIDDWLVFAGTRPELASGPRGVPVLGERAEADSPRRALGMVALDAARILGTSERERIRVCASETCETRFFDRSPAGRRRWCSMEVCGNAAKARRHRARQKAGA